MPLKLATCCWLLAALASTTASAQTHPKKKLHPRAVVGHKSVQGARERLQEDHSVYCYLPFEIPSERQEVVSVEEDPNRAYTYVEQMPTLNGQSSFACIAAALQQCLVLPPAVPSGRVFVQFVVTKEGVVSQPQVLKGLRADVDSAVVAATRQLPYFTPGKQNGRPVPVSLTLPIAIVAQRP